MYSRACSWGKWKAGIQALVWMDQGGLLCPRKEAREAPSLKLTLVKLNVTHHLIQQFHSQIYFLKVKSEVHTNACMQFFTAVLFIIATNCKQTIIY